MSKVNSDGYINIQGWMVSELGLKGNELLIYAIIYGFSQDGESKFTGSRQYLADWTNTTVKNVQNVLNNLVDKGLLNKYEKYINNLKFCEYKALKIEIIQSEEKVPGEGKNYTGVGKNFPKGREKSSHNNLINNLEDNLDKKIDTSAEAESFDQEKIKFIQNMKDYIFRVEEATGKNKEEISRVINPSLMKNYNMELLLKKIDESKFLSGKTDTRPKINNFCSKTMIDKILIGFYEDRETKKVQKNLKQKIEKEQYSGEWW